MVIAPDPPRAPAPEPTIVLPLPPSMRSEAPEPMATEPEPWIALLAVVYPMNAPPATVCVPEPPI